MTDTATTGRMADRPCGWIAARATRSPCFCVSSDWTPTAASSDGLKATINSLRPMNPAEARAKLTGPGKSWPALDLVNWSDVSWPPATLKYWRPAQRMIGECPDEASLVRCLPRLLNLGPPKAGSSSLFNPRASRSSGVAARQAGLLVSHPQVRLGAAKELCPFWWADLDAAGRCEPTRGFGISRLTEWSRWFDESVGASSVLVSGCNELGWGPVPSDFTRFVSSLPPMLSMLAPLREPAGRAYSQFVCCFFRDRLLSRGWLTQDFFHVIIVNATRALQDAVIHLRSGGTWQADAPQTIHQAWPLIMSHCKAVEPEAFEGEKLACAAIKHLLLPGIYVAPLLTLRKLGRHTSLDGRRQVLAFFLEDMSNASAYATFARALGRLLAVDPAPWLTRKFPTANRHNYVWNESTRPAMNLTMHPETYMLLQRFYARYNEALGRELRLGRTPWEAGGGTQQEWAR